MTPEQLKASILQWAMEGKLVKQDPNDEPASVLLEKIKAEKLKLMEAGKIKKSKELLPVKDDEKPFKIPSSWEWIKLGCIARLITKGTTPRGGKRVYLDKGVNYYRAENVKNGLLDMQNVNHISSKISCGPLKRSILENHDVLITIAGTLGRVGIVHKDNLPGNVNQAIAICRLVNSQLIHAPFLVYAISNGTNENKKRKKVTAIPNFTLKQINEWLIPLPPLNEQRRIVAKIEKLMPLVDKYAEAYNRLKAIDDNFDDKLKQSILQYAMEGKLVKQDPNDEPASVLLKKIKTEKEKLVKAGKIKKSKKLPPIKDSEKPFKIPTSWEWVRLGNISFYQNGYAYKSRELSKNKIGMPVIKSQNIMTLKVVIKERNDYIQKPNKKMLRSQINKNDLLMCLSSQSQNQEPLGKTAIYNLDKPALLNQRVLKLRLINISMLHFVYYSINSPKFHYIVSHKGSGSGQSNLKLNEVREMLIPVPPLMEQKRIVVKIDEIFRNIKDSNEQ